MLQQSSADLMESLSQILVPITVSEVLEDGEFRFLAINDAHCQASGLTPEQTVGQRPRDLVPGPEAARVIARYQQAVNTGQAQTYDELLSLPAGKTWWRTSASPIKDSRGAVRRLCVSSVPVDLEMRLRALSDKLGAEAASLKTVQPAITSAFEDGVGSLETIARVGRTLSTLAGKLEHDERVMVELVVMLATSAQKSLERAKDNGLDQVNDFLEQALLMRGSVQALLQALDGTTAAPRQD